MTRLALAACAAFIVAPHATAQTPTIAYEIIVDTAKRNTHSVTMQVRGAGDVFQIAFAKHPEYDNKPWRWVKNIAVAGGSDARITRVDSALWRVNARGGSATITYEIVTPPFTGPRPAYRSFITPTGGLIGDLHSFAYVVGYTKAPARVKVSLPTNWQIATQLQRTSDPTVFVAPNADALMDAPMLVGHLRDWSFSTDTTRYRVVYWAAPMTPDFDASAFVTNLTKVTDAATELFGAVPWREYTFLLQDAALGALEHANSVIHGAMPRDIQFDSWELMPGITHEFFHAWNLVRIKPAEWHGVDYKGQPSVASHWFSEGVTMYYADVLLRRARIQLGEPIRTEHLQRLLAEYRRNPAYAKFTAEQISRVANAEDESPLGDYDASTHVQGEILGTVLDLIIRDATNDKRSMDDVMRALNNQFGGPSGRGITNADIERTIEATCACDVTPFFDAHIRGSKIIDINRYLRLAGLEETVTWRPVQDRDGNPSPDVRLRAWTPPGDSSLSLIISNPTNAWARAGLHSGDKLIAMNGTPMRQITDARNFLLRQKIGDTVVVDIVRAGKRERVSVPIVGFQQPAVRISELAGATAKQRAIRDRWMRAEP